MPIVLTFDFPPARGGIQLYARRLAQELHALGRNVAVVAPAHAAATTADDAIGCPVVRFRGRGALRVAGALGAWLRARRIARDRQTIALSWLPALAVALMPQPLRGTLTVLVHGTEIDAPPGSLRDRAMRFAFARASGVVANSAYVARRACALGLAARPAVVWPGVDARTIARDPAPTPTIAFVGRLVARKGLDRLIDALPLLERDDVVVDVIGDGPERAALEHRARVCGVADRVRFHGALDDDARDRALGAAWCFAMPARAEGGDVEGFGIAYLEAAMAGIPAIGGREGGAGDAIADGETGLLIDGRDAHALARAIAMLIADPARAAAMGRAARARAERTFSWRANALALDAHLAQVTAG
jgi:phosphatidylinositol alpha-1,6-mannosyltransferase